MQTANETITTTQQREVNEAKQKLITLIGQVEQKHGRTARITLRDAARRNALDARALAVLRESIERGGETWELAVLAALHRLRKVEAQRGSDYGLEEWEIRHREFHLAVVGACESPLLLQFCATLRDLNDRYRRLFLANYTLDRDVADEHQAIADAALAHDADTACRLLGEHIQRTARNVFRVLDEGRGNAEKPVRQNLEKKY